MKYRIKIITYNNMRKEYIPQYKKGGIFNGWSFVSYEGSIRHIPYAVDSREKALKMIDLHFSGNNEIYSIEFQMINK